MKVAIIGSRGISNIDISAHLQSIDVSEIVSGGAIGVDRMAKDYAAKNGIKYVEFLPDYCRFKRAAPIVRNKQIVNHSDVVLAFWDGSSKGTLSAINFAIKTNKPITVCLVQK